MGARVQTVRGDVDPSVLGRTLTHEHLSMEFSHFYRRPPRQLAEAIGDSISLGNVGHVRQYPYSSKYNLLMNDEDTRAAVLEDVAQYAGFGGGSIVENSNAGLARDPVFLQEVSESTGVHIVAGAGFYIADTQSDCALHYTREEIYAHMLADMTTGVHHVSGDRSEVKAGFLGEIASVWPLKDFERKAIQATGELQEQLGCGVSFHPHRAPEAPFEIIRLYLEAGGRPEKAVMSHLDRTFLDEETLLEFAKLGVFCQYDLFGVEVSYYQLNPPTDMPSDAERINRIKLLVDEGHVNSILMSHDIHTKHRLAKFGGHGYSHIINNILPRMKSKGISQDEITKITVENPARWLTLAS